MARDAKLFTELEKDASPSAEGVTTGILPDRDIAKLIAGGRINAEGGVDASQVQPASLDLRLGKVAWRVRASFLPGKASTVKAKIDRLKMHQIDLTKPVVLEKGCVYIAELMEELRLPADIAGYANPKSSTGRLDIFTRLITDCGAEFEGVAAGYKGKLYVEIMPHTFSVLAQQGTRLNQIRFVRGNPPPSDAKLTELDQAVQLVYSDAESPLPAIIKNGLWISVDLEGDASNGIIGYRAKHHAPLIDLSKIDHYDPLDFWEPIARNTDRSLVLNPDDFYILVSRERVRIPNSYAASMVPYDPSVGEFRIHYAGFFDPGFGYGASNLTGARAVLEVRSHDVPFMIEHGQDVGRLIYERLLGEPEKIYGVNIGSNYQSQGLKLSKQFKPLAMPV
ncbi:MAG: 2'-deoxycytidine 5'-triphosphate deaminase [Betaproteobacteria bacterium]|jgi:dCTP deaminase|nr:2'-deoxycytidine 5'-triphosphate deaminase [Betaproteobacteria bacterium]MDH4293248.1 2'-deoxycytidine 5'-triphosphate deaminase [Betaproteobacteria bacterium]MDH5342353.1 2'-deoxycytidine 5'-triphosphate deaminase [Betaproteobacteria bacterium]